MSVSYDLFLVAVLSKLILEMQQVSHFDSFVCPLMQSVMILCPLIDILTWYYGTEVMILCQQSWNYWGT